MTTEPTHIQELKAELAAIRAKNRCLVAFIGTGKFEQLDAVRRQAAIEQQRAASQYETSLISRIQVEEKFYASGE